MCGIAGFIGEDRARIEAMTKALVHRGPDGNAVFVGNGISFGHARLAILDPRPEGDQPMWNHDHTIIIVFNGEIMNYRQLKTAENFDCRTGTDTEVILKLYERYGAQCVKYLRGMFAFGLFDTRTKTLLLARDESGIKPLYITTTQGAMHFSSEMRSLMKALPTRPSINERSLSHYLNLQYVPGPETMCEGIESVPPGTMITITESGKRKTERVRAEVSPIHFRSRSEAMEYLPTLFQHVVSDHLVSDKPVGIFLSGGMDSSIVLHHMAQSTDQKIRTFTVRFEATVKEGSARFNADADLAALTAKHYGTEHTELLLTAEDFRASYADVARALDQPNADFVSVAQYLLARKAKESVDVVLTGAGGDELFGGYPRYRIAKILHALRMIPASWRGILGMHLGYPRDVLELSSGPALWTRLLARPKGEWDPFIRDAWFHPRETEAWMERMWQVHDCGDAVRTCMDVDRATWLVDESLRLVDGTTMASGLEARVPFLDPLVIAASYGTKASWNVGWKRTKALLKDTYRPILPPHLFSLSKASFYPPLSKWLRRECAPLVLEAIEHPFIVERFDTALIRSRFEEHRSGNGYHLHMLHAITELAHWYDAVYRE